MKTEDRELNQAMPKPDTVDQPVRTARTTVHHYNSTQYCNTETVFSVFPFLQTNITSQMWPSGGKEEEMEQIKPGRRKEKIMTPMVWETYSHQNGDRKTKMAADSTSTVHCNRIC